MNKVKKHFQDHKAFYYGVGTGVAIVAVGCLVLRSKSEAIGAVKVQQVGFRNDTNVLQINFVERSCASKPVHLKGTNLYWPSIHDAARETGHFASRISQNVNGKIPHVKGDVFEFVEKAVEDAA